MYCSVATTINRCKTEGVVDVFQVVKALRVHKPGAVPSVVSSSAYSYYRACIPLNYKPDLSASCREGYYCTMHCNSCALLVFPTTHHSHCVHVCSIWVLMCHSPLAGQLQGCFRGLVGLLGLLRYLRKLSLKLKTETRTGQQLLFHSHFTHILGEEILI